MTSLTIQVKPLAYEQVPGPWLGDWRPYTYQRQVYDLIAQALTDRQTLCLFLVTPTGSGKTLGSYAYAINHGVPAFGVYPTNELIRDQERALKPWLDPNDEYRLLHIDSKQLDDWQAKLDLDRHAPALERLLNWEPTVLTNPDILFYTFFGLYRGPGGLSQRLFSLIGRYRLFVFDEFHLYNVKQMADVAYLLATLQAINPHLGRVAIFASATPDSPMLPWLRQNLNLPVEVVQAQPGASPAARTIAHPVRLTLVPADLGRWQGTTTLVEYLPQVEAFLAQYPQARLVTILDSVAGAMALAQTLRERFPQVPVGEVHGFTSEQEREAALQRPFTVGTSTIEVGIDFKDATGKDILIFEARTASQFIQRFGRLGRHAKAHDIPNWCIALVPEYVYHFLADKLASDRQVTRQQLTEVIDEAYQAPEDFAHYLRSHAPAEFHAARWHAQSLFQADDRPMVAAGLEKAIEALTGKSAGQAAGQHRRYNEQKILAPLLTFRGTGFEAAILDERGSDPGFPARRYDLFFLLRRGICEEIDEDTYLQTLEKLAGQWSEEVARERRYARLIKSAADELLGVYGFFRLAGMLEHSRRVWFEAPEEVLAGRKAEVTVLSGLEIGTDPEMRLRRLNRHLRRKQLVAWFIDRHPSAIKLGRALPSLFALYELRVRRPGGRLSDQPWTIAFNQNAFFLDSLGWWREKKQNDPIIL
ncbi:type I-D CRISPR-associated helicase Cas3' [Litorilinea aerophila]|uniref:Type I-D CRISPR-associated helicase Cas3 n=1 Tax=Litorilinea aerophila TaxID=1204385 RepID=A0A540VB84_9CHLR|nr:type I-D CRISPR-associated helicase Cas3' [Litorilinea aerophila]MCC9078143.1 type I-D CRISPR-associated helicase Cas3' [Litorilinea aerophila]OUC09388.1 hypothetical protein RY27_03145 [Litorilinea aerophila]